MAEAKYDLLLVPTKFDKQKIYEQPWWVVCQKFYEMVYPGPVRLYCWFYTAMLIALNQLV